MSEEDVTCRDRSTGMKTQRFPLPPCQLTTLHPNRHSDDPSPLLAILAKSTTHRGQRFAVGNLSKLDSHPRQ
jgi:hypothetical protein